MSNYDPCVVCNSSNFEPLKSVEWALFSFGTLNVTFGICRDCGHISQNPFIDSDTIEAIYSSYAEKVDYHISDADIRLPEIPVSTRYRLRELAKRFVPEKGRVFEIGCGSGENLWYLKNDGWDAYGCEPSPVTQKIAQHRIGEDKISQGFAADAITGEADYDLVISSHVLEHVTNPAEMISQAVGLMKDDGHIIIEVPCSRQAHRLAPGWLNIEHLSYFSAGGVTRLAEEAGLEVMETILDDEYPLFPAVCLVCRKNTGRAKPQSHFNEYELNRHCLAEYLEEDRAHWEAIAKNLEGLETAYIWGAGNLTSQLLAETGFGNRANILNIVDSNPMKAGKYLSDYLVIDKQKFQEEYGNQPVVIASYFSAKEIASSLIELGVPRENIVTLYS